MSELIVSFLGRVKITHRQRGDIPLANRKALALLAYLLLESDRAHDRAFLLGLLWPDLPTAAAQNNLRVTWAHLQKTFGAGDTDVQPLLMGDRLTLRINPRSDHALDVARFRALMADCAAHPHRDPTTCAECVARLTEAVALVRGELLDAFALGDCAQFDEWLGVQREHVYVQVTAALEQLAAFYERAGQLAEAERTARRLIARDPLREPAYRQLMRVLARADQRAAALDAFDSCRRALAAELGVSPALETVALAEQIRAHAPPDATTDAQAALPPVMTRFFGRDAECARLVDLLARASVRLVTLVGPGGVGKTRLALEVARRMAGAALPSICVVELAGVADGRAVDDAVAAALRLPINASRSSADAVVAYLRDRTLLLVLDNCEHLAPACARLVETLCRAAARLTVLATSRAPLRLAEEQVVRLAPFATPAAGAAARLTVAESLRFDAVQLFVSRASHSLLTFTLSEANVGAVARICQQLDGIPLAIEIAAAQTRALPVAAIAERLDQRFAWQQRRGAAALPRQQTLHTLIDWSYELLGGEDRALLRQLAVFAGGWTLEAAEAVSGAGPACGELLAGLVDHSLVVFGADVQHRRYSMHETIRQFAQERLRGTEQEAEALGRHAHYYAGLVARAAESSAGAALPEWLAALREEHDNLGRAFTWLLAHDHEAALTLVARLGTKLNFWELGGYFPEGRRWLAAALERTAGRRSVARAQALLAAAQLSSAIADFAYGFACVEEARELFAELDDPHGEIDARLQFITLADLANDIASAQVEAEDVLASAERLSYKAGVAHASRLLGLLAFHSGDDLVALAHDLKSVALWRELGHPFELATALNNLAGALIETDDYGAARQAFEESRDIYRALGYRRGVATVTQNLGVIARNLGDYASARALFRESLIIRRELGLQRGYAYSLEYIAEVDEEEHRYERAVQLQAAAAALRARIGAPIEPTRQQEYDAMLARLREQLGDVAFVLAWAKGAALTIEQAIDLALG